MKIVRNQSLIAAALLSVLALTSCTTTSQMRTTKATGFLGDYSQLHKGPSGGAQLVYIRPDVNWAAYHKVMIDPITAYAVPGNPLSELSKEHLNALVQYLWVAVSEQVGKDFQIVNAAGPGVLRLRIALTEAGANKPVIGVVSSVVPVGMAVSLLKTAVTGSGSGTGYARAELEILDAQTQQRLLAAVDAQAGNKRDFYGAFFKWDDAQDAFNNWAAQLHKRLMELRAGGR